ncbi:MAG TPA: PD-(D/E)XK nuclease family protein [Burkholderiaceae bacterium]|nr:PD-(D/E)XK nuclease family protein [Burkholderiaceae bacterium]
MSSPTLALERTRPVSPSKLASFTTCPLRYLLETERPANGGLSRSPMALRGTIAHTLIERFTGKPLPTAQVLIGQFHVLLAAALTRDDAGPLLKLSFEAAGTAGILNSAQVVSACGFAMRVLKTRPQGQRATPAATAGRGSAGPLGPERKFEAPSLDLAGYIDLAYADSSGNIHIVDYKTGSVLNDDGAPRPEYQLQLAAYGVLAKKVLEPQKVFLELAGASSSWQGELTADLEATVLQLVDDLRHQLPRNRGLDASRLAKPGIHCQECRSRPSCPSYVNCLRYASTGDQRLSPRDVAGDIVEAYEKGAFTSLRLRTSNGYTVSIAGIPTQFLQGATTGDRLAGYSLGYFDDLTSAKFAANFFIYRADNPAASAFEATLKVSA